MKSKSEKAFLFLMVLLSVVFTDFLTGLIIIPEEHNAYRQSHYFYHHGLSPNRADRAKWGDRSYRVFTNSLGLRDGSIRTVSLVPAGRRILMMGDSFTEGIGVSFDDSFAGLVSRRTDAEILNAGVVGYSPKLYYLKTRHLVEKVGLRFHELIVFIDISDIINELEYEDYVPEEIDPNSTLSFSVQKLLRSRSATYYLLGNLMMNRQEREKMMRLRGDTPCWGVRHPEIYNSRIESAWTVDDNVFQRFGRQGIRLAEENMQLLADLCKKHGIDLSIAVYPWPTQIYFYDRDSRQVSLWRDFAKRNGLKFINYFPEFIDRDRYSGFDEVYGKYFIPDDMHWNEEGHGIIAERLIEFLGTGNTSAQ